jgi:hypothetical protein
MPARAKNAAIMSFLRVSWFFPAAQLRAIEAYLVITSGCPSSTHNCLERDYFRDCPLSGRSDL